MSDKSTEEQLDDLNRLGLAVWLYFHVLERDLNIRLSWDMLKHALDPQYEMWREIRHAGIDALTQPTYDVPELLRYSAEDLEPLGTSPAKLAAEWAAGTEPDDMGGVLRHVFAAFRCKNTRPDELLVDPHVTKALVERLKTNQPQDTRVLLRKPGEPVLYTGEEIRGVPVELRGKLIRADQPVPEGFFDATDGITDPHIMRTILIKVGQPVPDGFEVVDGIIDALFDHHVRLINLACYTIDREFLPLEPLISAAGFQEFPIFRNVHLWDEWVGLRDRTTHYATLKGDVADRFRQCREGIDRARREVLRQAGLDRDRAPMPRVQYLDDDRIEAPTIPSAPADHQWSELEIFILETLRYASYEMSRLWTLVPADNDEGTERWQLDTLENLLHRRKNPVRHYVDYKKGLGWYRKDARPGEDPNP